MGQYKLWAAIKPMIGLSIEFTQYDSIEINIICIKIIIGLNSCACGINLFNLIRQKD